MKRYRVLYVGCTHSIGRRKRQHLELKTHTSEWLGEIGVDKVYIEEVCKFESKQDALVCEDEMIKRYNTLVDGYNKQRSGGYLVRERKKMEKEVLKDKSLDAHKQNLLSEIALLGNCDSIIKQYKDQGFDILGEIDDICKYRDIYKRVFEYKMG